MLYKGHSSGLGQCYSAGQRSLQSGCFLTRQVMAGGGSTSEVAGKFSGKFR